MFCTLNLASRIEGYSSNEEEPFEENNRCQLDLFLYNIIEFPSSPIPYAFSVSIIWYRYQATQLQVAQNINE